MKILQTFLIFNLLVFFPKLAHAYIDPGIFSIVIQGIIGAAVSVIVFLKFYYHKIKILIQKIFKNKKN